VLYNYFSFIGAVADLQRQNKELQRELQSVRAQCDRQGEEAGQQAEALDAAAEREAQSRVQREQDQAAAAAQIERRIADVRAEHEQRVRELEKQLAERPEGGFAAAEGADASSGTAEIEGLRQSVKELSEQVQRYAEAAEGLSTQLEEAHAAQASLEEQVLTAAPCIAVALLAVFLTPDVHTSVYNESLKFGCTLSCRWHPSLWPRLIWRAHVADGRDGGDQR